MAKEDLKIDIAKAIENNKSLKYKQRAETKDRLLKDFRKFKSFKNGNKTFLAG